jgi:predicted nucleotidyltransferase component of viral defense system
MIPQAFITEWSQQVPWQANEQVEQDLVICRALVEIFSDEWLKTRLAFRGGTALHKLFLNPQARYSEDIDLVQISSGPIKDIVEHLQSCLTFLGKASTDTRKLGMRVNYHYESEFSPIQRMKLKVEINTREHFSVLGHEKVPFEIKSSWYTRSCIITTYKLEELLGTKLRALYQRRKGRDLFDLDLALKKKPELNKDQILKCFKEYMQFSVGQYATKKQFLKNMESKIQDNEFLGDTTALLRPGNIYNPQGAWETLRTDIIEKI